MIRSKITMGFLWALLTLALYVSPGIVAPAHAQGTRKDDIVFNSRGIPLAGATVRVCVMPASGQPCTPLAQIFSDAALTQALANPTTTDGLGNYFFYAAPGKYEIEFSGPAITTKQIPNVILPSDPTSPSFSSISSSGGISAFSLNLTGNLTVNGNTTVVGNLASGTLNLANQSTAPGTAGTGTVNLYTKTADKRLYYKDDTGTEIGPIANTTGAQTNVPNTFTAAQTFTGQILCKNLENIRCAAQFAGADWCAKESAADSDLGAPSGEIWIDTSAGTSACAAAPTLSSNHVLRFIQGGTYNIGVGWTITNQNNWGIAGLPGKLTTIQFTGSAGFTATGAGLTNLSFGDKIVDVTFSGNAGIANPVTLIGITKSFFDFSARNGTGFAVVCQGCLLNTGRIVVSSNEGTFTTVPTGGVLLDKLTSPLTLSNKNDIFYILEGINGTGWECKNGNLNKFMGTSEGNVRGIQTDSTCNFTTVDTADLENNSTEDALANGVATIFLNSICASTTRVHAGSTAAQVWIWGLHSGTSNCVFTPAQGDAGASGLIEMDPQSMATVNGNWMVLSRGVGSFLGGFVTNTTANRFWTMQDLTGTVSMTIASGTSTLGNSSIAATTCNAAVTTTAAGAATTDAIEWAYASAPSGTTDGKLILSAYVTSGNVNFVLCNPTAGALIPTGLVVNWRVVR